MTDPVHTHESIAAETARCIPYRPLRPPRSDLTAYACAETDSSDRRKSSLEAFARTGWTHFGEESEYSERLLIGNHDLEAITSPHADR
jgi:hypothetical protein